jgi:hemolysin activation/secretion protein
MNNSLLPSPRQRVVVLATAFCLVVPLMAHADGPIRGNPLESIPSLEKPQQPKPGAPLQAPVPTPEQQAVAARLNQHIVPRNFDVSGVHAIPFTDVSGILAPLAGKDITIGQLVQQVDRITAMYRERGFPLSFAVIQNQDFANGVVKVTVVEGYISKLNIDGDLGNSEKRLRYLAEPLLAEKPLTQKTLERQLNLMRMVPGVTFTPSLDLPRRADGATELSLKATHKPFSATGGVQDLGTGMQPIVNVGMNSLTPLGEQTKLTASVPFNTDDVKYYAAEVAVPVGNKGAQVKVNGYHYEAKPADEAAGFEGFDRKVTNDRIGVDVSYPFILSNQTSVTGTLGVYALNGKDRYDLKGTDFWLQQNSDVRAVTGSVRYLTVGEKRSTDVTVGVTQGTSGLGAKNSITSNFGYSAVPLGDLNFTHYNVNAKQTFVLPNQFGVTLASAGQYTDDVLPTSEQISFGSWRFGLGYPQGEISGDKGMGASAELNRRFFTGWKYLSQVQPYTSIDYARTWYNAKPLQPFNNVHLSSVAVGFRLTDDKYYLFDVNVAKPIGSETLNDSSRSWRFNANYSLFWDAL